MKHISIVRTVDGPFVDFIIRYKGEYVSAISVDEVSAPYDAAKALAGQFLADLRTGNVSDRYLGL